MISLADMRNKTPINLMSMQYRKNKKILDLSFNGYNILTVGEYK